MESEKSPPGLEGQQGTEPVPRRSMSSRRKKKLAIALIIIVVALVVILWGWSSTGGSFVDVSTIVDASAVSVPEKYLGKMDIRGIVSDWSGGASLDFVLLDSESPTKSISVSVTGTIPEGFENGKTVVAKGYLDESLPLRMTVTEITVGCASKY